MDTLSKRALAIIAAVFLVAGNAAVAYWVVTKVTWYWATDVMIVVIVLEALGLIFLFRRWGRAQDLSGEQIVDAVEAAMDLEIQRPEPKPEWRRPNDPNRRWKSQTPQSDNERLFHDRKDQDRGLSGWDLL